MFSACAAASSSAGPASLTQEVYAAADRPPPHAATDDAITSAARIEREPEIVTAQAHQRRGARGESPPPALLSVACQAAGLSLAEPAKDLVVEQPVGADERRRVDPADAVHVGDPAARLLDDDHRARDVPDLHFDLEHRLGGAL